MISVVAIKCKLQDMQLFNTKVSKALPNFFLGEVLDGPIEILKKALEEK